MAAEPDRPEALDTTGGAELALLFSWFWPDWLPSRYMPMATRLRAKTPPRARRAEAGKLKRGVLKRGGLGGPAGGGVTGGVSGPGVSGVWGMGGGSDGGVVEAGEVEAGVGADVEAVVAPKLKLGEAEVGVEV